MSTDTDRMEQDEDEQPGMSVHLKRSRPVQADGSDTDDDNVSLVSRTPSPPPGDVVGVDKYDEYIHRVPREVITVETKIKSTNKGFAMLAKLGWTEGQPLGLSGEGRVDPIPFQIKNDFTGLGKISQDVRMIETTVSQRRELDSERQRKETQDQRKAREDTVAKRAAVKSEITDTLRPFYCTLCEKQFQNVAQYDEHTNSYAHHHKARLKDMQANARLVNQEELEKRQEKERKREEKELRKLAKAQGIKMVKHVAGPSPVLVPETDAAAMGEAKSGGFKKAGWAAVTAIPKPPESDSKHSGWTTVGPSPFLPANSPPPPTDAPPPIPSSSLPTPDVPMFRAGGWTFLDSNGSHSVIPPLSPPVPLASPPLPPADPPPSMLFPNRREAGGHSLTSISDPYPSPQPTPPTSLCAPLPPPPVAPSKSGWQQWKQGNSFKRR